MNSQHKAKLDGFRQQGISAISLLGGNTKTPPALQNRQMSGVDGGQAQFIEHNDFMDNFTITIENTDTANDLWVPLFSINDKFAIPFGASTKDIDGTVPTANKGAKITVDGDTTYDSILSDIRDGAIWVPKVRYTYGDDIQLNMGWKARIKNTSNEYSTKTYKPKLSKKASDFALTYVDVEFATEVNSRFTLFVKVAKADATTNTRIVTLDFFIAAKMNVNNALSGKSAIQTFQV